MRLTEINKISVEHTESLARIVAIAFHPGKKVPESLVTFLLDNLEIKEMEKVALIVLESLNINSFITTIITLKGTNILKSAVSPIPVPGVSLEAP
jgi:hypothetical protein